MDHERVFRVGDFCTFRDRGVSREGKIVAAEDVGLRDRRGRTAGRWFVVKINGELFETAEVPERELGGILHEAVR